MEPFQVEQFILAAAELLVIQELQELFIEVESKLKVAIQQLVE